MCVHWVNFYLKGTSVHLRYNLFLGNPLHHTKSTCPVLEPLPASIWKSPSLQNYWAWSITPENSKEWEPGEILRLSLWRKWWVACKADGWDEGGFLESTSRGNSWSEHEPPKICRPWSALLFYKRIANSIACLCVLLAGRFELELAAAPASGQRLHSSDKHQQTQKMWN